MNTIFIEIYLSSIILVKDKYRILKLLTVYEQMIDLVQTQLINETVRMANFIYGFISYIHLFCFNYCTQYATDLYAIKLSGSSK